jgi:hypothetical protein
MSLLTPSEDGYASSPTFFGYLHEVSPLYEGEGPVVENVALWGGRVVGYPIAAVGGILGLATEPVIFVVNKGNTGTGVFVGAIVGGLVGNYIGEHVVGIPVYVCKKVFWDTPRAVIGFVRKRGKKHAPTSQ